ncbi:MAG TPA: hypothetical protein VGQ87_00380 [Patescibacteria group bacterium]|jgi:hypothetical protein|nr:hypothetical protein [Patescibacteria group bacterium]
MDQNNLQRIDKSKICEICAKHDPMVKDYSDDYELQTALRNYLEKKTGERVNVVDIARLCDSCYAMVAEAEEVEE